MIDVRFEIGGRRLNPRDVGSRLEAAIMDGITKSIRTKVEDMLRDIRHPETGETPVVVVRGNDLQHRSFEVRGSEELVRLVSETLRGGASHADAPASEADEDDPS